MNEIDDWNFEKIPELIYFDSQGNIIPHPTVHN